MSLDPILDSVTGSDTAAASAITRPKADTTEQDGGFAALLNAVGDGGAEQQTAGSSEQKTAGLEESSGGESSSGLPMSRPLSEEEERRLQWLQDQLQQCLLSLADHPSEQTRERVRELEKEISELTGVKTQSSLSKTAESLTKLYKYAKDEDEDRGEKMPGDLAMELGTTPLPFDDSDGGPDIMNFYQQNLAAFGQSSLTASSGSMASALASATMK